MSTRSIKLCRGLTFGIAALMASTTFAQVRLTGIAGELPPGDVVCYTTTTLRVSDNGDTCANGTEATGVSIGTDQITLNGTSANFTIPVNISGTNFQASGLQAFSGTSTFNSTVSFVGPSATFDTITTFNNSADFNASITTNGISNTGNIFTTGVTTVGIQTSNMVLGASLTVLPGANLNMGNNIIHGVAAGVANTDAVNVAQLNAATAGITADVTALETLTATHTTQITAMQALNTTQSNQISALQAAQDLFEGQVDALFDLRTRDRRDMKQGAASAMAMAAAPMPSEPGRIAYAVNGATFRGEYAVGGSLTYRLNTRAPMAVNLGFSYAGNKNNGARIGFAGEF